MKVGKRLWVDGSNCIRFGYSVGGRMIGWIGKMASHVVCHDGRSRAGFLGCCVVARLCVDRHDVCQTCMQDVWMSQCDGMLSYVMLWMNE